MPGSLAAVVVMEVLQVVMLKRRKNPWLSWGLICLLGRGLDVSVWPVVMEEVSPLLLLLCPSADSGGWICCSPASGLEVHEVRLRDPSQSLSSQREWKLDF